MWPIGSRWIVLGGSLAVLATPAVAQVARVPDPPTGLRALPTEAEIVDALQPGGSDSAKSLLGEVGHIDGALDTLEQMLEQPAIRPTLSVGSRALIRQVAAERLADRGRPETAWSTLAHAAYLAVATGDPQLRKQVSDLTSDDGELVRRGVVDVEKQEWFKKVIGEALGKTFQN